MTFNEIIIIAFIVSMPFLPGYMQNVGRRFGQGFMQGVNKEFDNQFDQFVKMQKTKKPEKEEHKNG